MYRLYAEYDGLPIRTGRAVKSLEAAVKAAKRLNAEWVEIRLLLKSGKEALIDILVGGNSVRG